ncbi:MaoC/PaaZ C-terminal domain-containing protein [Hydrogenophaga sp. BPS33]|uniref:MaoC/PaaZ C-terminal domain-containing protein n=1 Tax=Hydrogenophaga sp. BPS33 TaxID=2651974 RepID=UPI001F368531|nr:MaoC/PaaZ C-terminal domain-containing protein [Hydrogenophaga sp. BPS33]
MNETWESPPTVVTAEEIVAFGHDFDPQPMHIDAAQAAQGPFKTLIASGWHVAAISWREFHRAGGYGGTPVVGLGVDELRWHRPVRAGDVITVHREVIELRRSGSSPTHGIVRTRVSVRTQNGETAMTLLTASRIPCREVHP